MISNDVEEMKVVSTTWLLYNKSNVPIVAMLICILMAAYFFGFALSFWLVDAHLYMSAQSTGLGGASSSTLSLLSAAFTKSAYVATLYRMLSPASALQDAVRGMWNYAKHYYGKLSLSSATFTKSAYGATLHWMLSLASALQYVVWGMWNCAKHYYGKLLLSSAAFTKSAYAIKLYGMLSRVSVRLPQYFPSFVSSAACLTAVASSFVKIPFDNIKYASSLLCRNNNYGGANGKAGFCKGRRYLTSLLVLIVGCIMVRVDGRFWSSHSRVTSGIDNSKSNDPFGNSSVDEKIFTPKVGFPTLNLYMTLRYNLTSLYFCFCIIIPGCFWKCY